ncbi:hypothetical protein CathTA2_0493 [Caldalkalibacillus thermarum TA2.A1]|uniref:AtuA-like ferredoxin-fold domain-containing protein n=1 Tax=Caldalkalibacillus thermarum (strain TA2.A1) TaxID=986075 RepID=F5L3Y1_CALTT|nr:hypothetical protein [Caldalkalibacillus thermarum]EGL83959.1 hypothetical protein CathTA2_0493 [Caldalkalibacillus thermarum TA2.A1]QZT35066.1 hypothetical protein HUR95_07540 [Caldalkalibacillus thermarum TA2.A1]GGK12172.1 hypothetical protein GCM10010965_01470 [Caldalkalibacillus thermarum]
MAKVQLRYVAQARSGDKGNTCDLGLFAKTKEMYEVFKREVTPEKVKAHFAPLVKGEVSRYEVPNVYALKFVLEDALGGGAPSSLRTDNLGKSFGSNLLRMEIEVPDELLTEEHCIQVPPR